MNDILERLRAFLDAARLTIAEVKVDNPNARGIVGIGYKLPDGSGKLVCDFDSESFCDDIEAVINDLTKDKRMAQGNGARFVIKFPNDTYNRGCGFEADLTEATVYSTRDEAEAVNSTLMGGEVVDLSEAGNTPHLMGRKA